jgi:hypothetical protein
MLAERTRNIEGLERLLTEDVVSISDGGGEVPAALNPIRGRDKVLRLILKQAERFGDSISMAFRSFNGMPAILFESQEGWGGRANRFTMHCEVDPAGLIRRLDFVVAPSKLTRV